MPGTVARDADSGFEASEEAAVLAAVDSETQAYVSKDFDAWRQCWLDSERTTEVVVGNMGTYVHRGWRAVHDAMHKVMSEDPDPLPLPYRHTDFQVSISGNTAWVTFLSTCQVTGFERFDMPDSFETRVLERFGGVWKIVYVSVLALRSGPVDRSRILVDAKGQILWASDATMEALRKHPHLTVSAGRLRAVRPAWDKVLQSAIAGAPKLHHLSQFEETPIVSPERFVFPVVLGEDENGGVQSCVVYVRDGSTYVAFDDGHIVDRNLDLARLVFGLSDTQTRLAERIVKGHGLTDTARDLGISVNTARTHLRRIYDKTGVNTQTALVRVLLGVGMAGS